MKQFSKTKKYHLNQANNYVKGHVRTVLVLRLRVPLATATKNFFPLGGAVSKKSNASNNESL